MILNFDTKKQRHIWRIVFLSITALGLIVSFGGKYAFDLNGDELDEFRETFVFPMVWVSVGWILLGPFLLRLFVKE